MLLLDRAATAAKAFASMATMATMATTAASIALAGCAEELDPPSFQGASSGDASGGQGGAGGAGGQAGSGGAGDPCGQDCSVFGPADNPCYVGVCNLGEHPGPIHECVVVAAPADTACDDGLFCTAGDYCKQGSCIGGPPNTCASTPEACVTVTCDETTKSCTEVPAGEGSACEVDGSDKCEVNGKCTGGLCIGVPKDCSFSPLSECNAVACNPANGQCEGAPDAAKEGTKCVLTGDLCMTGKTCQAGACMGGEPKNCSALDAGCNNGVCNPQNGFCEVEAVPEGGVCVQGNDECNTGICDANATCVPTPKPDGMACTDFSTCTTNDTCTAGVCSGNPVAGCVFYLQSGFESCPENWTLSGDWACGTPSVVGPASAYAGSGVLATVIDGEYTNDNEWADEVAADSPTINLAGAVEPTLEFYGWVQTETTYDGVNLKVSTDNGVTWVPVAEVFPAYNIVADGQPAWGHYLEDLGWRRYVVDLGAYANQQIKLRFHFRSDVAVSYAGMYIDDLSVADAEVIALEILGAVTPPAVVGQPFALAPSRIGGSSAATWSIVGGSNHAWLTIDPITGALVGTPAAANAGPVSVTVRVEEPGLAANFDEATFAFDVLSPAYLQSFEGACPNGWTLTGEWDCGTPTLVGPPAAFSGLQCLGTNIGADYGFDILWGSMTATSPSISLAGLANPVLSWFAWVHTESASYDGYNLKVSVNGGAFNVVSAVTPAYGSTADGQPAWGGDQTGAGWTLYTADLGAFAGQSVQLRFDFTSDYALSYPGIYIDDVIVGE